MTTTYNCTYCCLPLSFPFKIVVFDEGHNVEGACRECASLEITATELASCVQDINNVHATPQAATALRVLEAMQGWMNEMEQRSGGDSEMTRVIRDIEGTLGAMHMDREVAGQLRALKFQASAGVEERRHWARGLGVCVM